MVLARRHWLGLRLAIGIGCGGLPAAWGQAATAVDASTLVTVQAGELPIILSAPHGGTLPIPDAEPRFHLHDVTVDDIRGGKLAGMEVLIHPGDSGGGQGRALGEEGRQAVREFVEAGGGYAGLCAGAYLATCDYDWSLHILDQNGAPKGVMPDTTAIASGSHHKGRVLCFSPHPERTDGLESLLVRGVWWAAGGDPLAARRN
jgi:putative intracellular protease/amidase